VARKNAKQLVSMNANGPIISAVIIRVAPQRAGEVSGFGFALTRRQIKTSGSGARHGNWTARAHPSGAGRFEEPLPAENCFPDGEAI